MADVCVHGLGTVGLPLAAVVALHHLVVGVEPSADRRAGIAGGDSFHGEPGLREAVDRALSAGRLRVVSEAVAASVHLICVPTPSRSNRADLTALHGVVDALGPLIRAGDLVVVESTVPPGAVDALSQRIPHALWAAAPERILPGRALDELRTVPRVVGGCTPEATERAAAFYRSLGMDVRPTDALTATLAKLVENTARSVQIALANELALLVEASGGRAGEVFELASTHPRVDLLQPGIGVGGHCIPVDPLFLVERHPELATLIRAAQQVNQRAQDRALDAIRAAAEPMGDPLIALLGAAYKPGTGDVRNSPALAIATALCAEGRRVLVVDDRVEQRAGLPWAPLGDALASADLVALLVAHPELVEAARGRGALDLTGALS